MIRNSVFDIRYLYFRAKPSRPLGHHEAPLGPDPPVPPESLISQSGYKSSQLEEESGLPTSKVEISSPMLYTMIYSWELENVP
jgi:hypothetical protein